MDNTQSNETYDMAKLRRLGKSDDFKELKRVINDIQEDLKSNETVDRSSAEAALASSSGKHFANKALQELLDTVTGAEDANINNSDDGDYNYT